MQGIEFQRGPRSELASRAERVLSNVENSGARWEFGFDVDRFSSEVAAVLDSEVGFKPEAAMWRAIFRSISLARFEVADGINGSIQSALTGRMNWDREVQRIMREQAFEFRVINGDRRYLSSPYDMEDPRCYRAQTWDSFFESTCFNWHDYQSYKTFLKETYGACDPALERILLRALPEALLDPRVVMVIARKKQELVATGKIKKNSRHTPHYGDIGGMYSDSEYRWDYGLGEFIGRVLMKEMTVKERRFVQPEYTLPVYGWVSIHSPAIERHFKHAGVIGTRLSYESDEYDVSEPVINLEKRDWRYFRHALSDSAPSDEELLRMFEAQDDRVEVGKVVYHLADTRKRFNREFLRQLEAEFGNGRFLTRVSLPRRGDCSQTILGFEHFARTRLDMIGV